MKGTRRYAWTLSLAVAVLLLAAHVRAQSLDADGDGLPDEWERQYGLDPSNAVGPDGHDGDPDADGISNFAEWQSGTHPRGISTKTFAEGSTGPFFDLRFALFNASPSTSARVLVRFLTADGNERSTFLVLAPHARTSIDPETIPGLEATAFATIVESDTEVVADRTMWWDKNHYGSHAETGVSGPALVWFLAEGATHSGFNLFYLLQNPNGAAATVTVTYLLPNGAPVVKSYAVAAYSRYNIWVNLESPDLASTDVSATITSTLPIVVERSMYLDTPGRMFSAGHASAGVTSPATTWYLAEGATGSFFDLFVLVAVPGDRDAEVLATFLMPDGSTITRTYTVPAKSRYTIWVDLVDRALADTSVSTTVTSTNGVPIIVERAMWWPGTGWYEAHNSAGATQTGTAWALAEGEQNGADHVQTYVLLANPSQQAATANVSLYFEDGGSTTHSFPVSPASRFTVDVGVEFSADFAGGRARRFATVVESTGSTPAPLIVERAMYSDAQGVKWAAGTNALGTRLLGLTSGGSGGSGGDALPSVSIAASQPTALEQGITPATLVVTRTTSTGTLVVPLVVDGTASISDFGPLPAAVIFLPGETSKTVLVTPTDDGEIEPMETVVVTLAASEAYTIAQASAAVRIIDNDTTSSTPALDDAVRFLDQASFGPTAADIARVRAIGLSAWIDEQMAAPQSGFLGYLDSVSGETISSNHVQEAWFQAATVGPDQLRQRVANALLEILVVGSTNGLEGASHAHAAYMDVLMRNAFGNYRTLLEQVTLSPAMGRYLDMLRNQREEVTSGRNPNENYAREILQLFSIGLYQLNLDGSLKRDGMGEPIPTYGLDEIQGFSRVFTGWTFNQIPLPAENFYPTNDWRNPMVPMSRYHSYSAKTLLDGETIPASNYVDPEGDLRKALDNIFRHPNIGPFIGRQLIQRLVTANPTPGYIERVARTFNDNGAGVRGDMAAVVRAILLDPEARSTSQSRNPYYGHLREPMIRFVSLLRAFSGRATSQKFRVWNLQNDMGQAPFRSPSVFNFFLPDYGKPGPITDAGLVSPEFQITSETSSIRAANTVRSLVYRGYGSGADMLALDFTTEQALATSPAQLVDHLNALLFGGALSSDVRSIVINTVTAVPEARPIDRVRMAIYLLVTSPEYLVQK